MNKFHLKYEARENRCTIQAGYSSVVFKFWSSTALNIFLKAEKSACKSRPNTIRKDISHTHTRIQTNSKFKTFALNLQQRM